MHGEATKVYNMITTTKHNADSLSAMMHKLAPTPSADATFIPHNVWNSLTPENKTQYLMGQSQYLLLTSAARFIGIQDSRLSIMITGPPGRNGVATSIRRSILSWVSNVKTLGGQHLFQKVFPGVNGDMLLMYNTLYKQEVRAWMSSALSEIASQSGLNPHIDQEAAEVMIKSPIKVWKNMKSRRQ